MTDLPSLYRYAEEEGIDVDYRKMKRASSLSVPIPDGSCAIAIDPRVCTDAEEKVRLAHELGHCKKGAFYNQWATCDIRQKHEVKADKWAIERLVPEDELNSAVENGYTEILDLAELFNVTESFMRKAAWWYKHGNMALEIY